MEEDKIIELLRLGDNSALQNIYEENRLPFIKFARKYNVNEHDAADIYQDSVIALRENAIRGKLDNLKGSISTYLFAIGKHKIYFNHRRYSKLEFDNELLLNEKNIEIDVNLYDQKLTKQQMVLKECLSELGEKCKNILILSNYQGFTLDEITNILDYSDKKVLKSQKSRCMRQLRELCKKKLWEI